MLNFQLVSSTGPKYDGEAYEILVPTKNGEIAVLEDHMPLIAAGKPGVLSVRKKPSDKELEHFAVYGGVLEVDGKTARFISEDVTTTDEVSEQEASESLARAKKLVQTAGTRQALQEAKNVVAHHETRLHLARLKRRHHR